MYIDTLDQLHKVAIDQGLDAFLYEYSVLDKWNQLLIENNCNMESAGLSNFDICILQLKTQNVPFNNKTSKLLLDEYLLLPILPFTCLEMVKFSKQISFLPGGYLSNPFYLKDYHYSIENKVDEKVLEKFFMAPYSLAAFNEDRNWNNFVGGLHSKKRYDINRAHKMYPDSKLILTPEAYKNIELLLSWLKTRFNETDVNYAIAQVLLGFSIEGLDRFFLKDQKGVILAYGCVCNNSTYAYGHSYVFNPDFKGVGQLFVSSIAKYYLENTNINFLNVGTGLYLSDDAWESDIYKKCVSNKEVFSLNMAVSNIPDLIPPYYSGEKGWILKQST